MVAGLAERIGNTVCWRDPRAAPDNRDGQAQKIPDQQWAGAWTRRCRRGTPALGE